MKSIIRNFVAKMVAGRSDDGIMITLSDPKKVDFQTAMLEDLLMRNGIDPQLIKTEDELKNISGEDVNLVDVNGYSRGQQAIDYVYRVKSYYNLLAAHSCTKPKDQLTFF